MIRRRLTNYRNLVAQNAWMSSNLFDALGNYKYCSACIVSVLLLDLRGSPISVQLSDARRSPLLWIWVSMRVLYFDYVNTLNSSSLQLKLVNFMTHYKPTFQVRTISGTGWFGTKAFNLRKRFHDGEFYVICRGEQPTNWQEQRQCLGLIQLFTQVHLNWWTKSERILSRKQPHSFLCEFNRSQLKLGEGTLFNALLYGGWRKIGLNVPFAPILLTTVIDAKKSKWISIGKTLSCRDWDTVGIALIWWISLRQFLQSTNIKLKKL